jgi:hypothetical protein
MTSYFGGSDLLSVVESVLLPIAPGKARIAPRFLRSHSDGKVVAGFVS